MYFPESSSTSEKFFNVLPVSKRGKYFFKRGGTCSGDELSEIMKTLNFLWCGESCFLVNRPNHLMKVCFAIMIEAACKTEQNK